MTVPNNRAYPRFTPKRGCVFCKIIAGRAKAEIVREWTYAVAFVPLNPVIEGHVLVAPREHLSDAQEYPWMTGRTFCAAADLSRDIGSCNLITSVGADATQSVRHLHIHVVPRREGDGLMLPWSGQLQENPCRGRCEFHGKLWCKETGGTCEEFIAALESRGHVV